MGGWKPFDHLCMFGQEFDTKVGHLKIEKSNVLDSNKVHAETSEKHWQKHVSQKWPTQNRDTHKVVQDAHHVVRMEKETLDNEKEITRHQNTSTGRGASGAVQEQHVVKEQWQVSAVIEI